MRPADWVTVALLALFAGFIWGRCLPRIQDPAGTLPILAGWPLFYWLKRPWQFAAGPWRLSPRRLAWAACLLPLGTLLDSTLLLAGSWTAMLGSWVEGRKGNARDNSIGKLLLLPFFSFPWLATDLERLSWWFRLSGAAATERLLAWTRFSVVRHGTELWVNGFQLSVEPSCSGMNGLQSLLIAGAVLAYLKLKDSHCFWWNLPGLLAAAWWANLLRILAAAWFGATWPEPATARWLGPAHEAAGWLALCLMFGLSWCLFSAEAWLFQERRWLRLRGGRQVPWLELILLAYCAWQSAGLIETWRHSPFDRWGWLAFALWLVSLGWPRLAGLADHGLATRNLGLLAGGLILTLAGNLGDLNAGRQIGLALVLMGSAPVASLPVSALGASSWLPATGWAASLAGLDPALVASGRIALALWVCAWSWRATQTTRLGLGK